MESERSSRRFHGLIVDAGREPASSQSEGEALAAWVAATVAWHPLFLATSDELPLLEDIEAPTSPATGDVRITQAGCLGRLPSGYRVQAEDSGAILIEGTTDRSPLIAQMIERLGLEPVPAFDEKEQLAEDFLALGTAHEMLANLTAAMSHADALDRESFTRETISAAISWQEGDANAVKSRLRASFELLIEARERFYPVDAYMVDIAFLHDSTPLDAVRDALSNRTPISFLANARAIESLANRDPELIQSLRDAINEGWADVIGGAYGEADEPLRPLESILWQFQRGGEVYREHLDSRNVETLARRRFGLYPQLPQIAKRFSLRFALHLGFDAGKFPIRIESKRLWEAPDGTSLESLLRPPLSADRQTSGRVLPWRLGATMRDDHVATLPLAHWAGSTTGWYRDLRRVASYSPVLAKWTTVNDYFHLTDRPYESMSPNADAYETPYLAQSVERREERPITRRAEHASLRARLDSLAVIETIVRSLSQDLTSLDGQPPISRIETSLETGDYEGAKGMLDAAIPAWAESAAGCVLGGQTDGAAGYLVFNPLGMKRKSPVLLPDAAANLGVEGPLRAAQFTEDGVRAVVDLPAFGYVWVPRESSPSATTQSTGKLGVKDSTLRNELIELSIDTATGGIRAFKALGEPTARVGQQLVISGLIAADGTPLLSRMVGEKFEVDYGGPALVQAFSTGRILGKGETVLARFQQTFRLWSGRGIVEIEITLRDLNSEWLSSIEQADPWLQNLACRWAWPDPSAMMRRTSLLGADLTESLRPETPDAIEITTRKQRTTLLMNGLAHHQRHGGRMLDTLLVAGRETTRTFVLGLALDAENPFAPALDLRTPPIVVPTESGPPKTGAAGWFFQADRTSVAITSIRFAERSGDGRGWGVTVHLLETAGNATRCRLRCFRDPVWARQVNFHEELIVDLPIDGDAVLVDLTPNELACVDITLG